MKAGAGATETAGVNGAAAREPLSVPFALRDPSLLPADCVLDLLRERVARPAVV